MPDRAVAFGLGRIETQLLVNVIEPNRLQIKDAADRNPAAHFSERHRHCRQVTAGRVSGDV